MARFKFTFNLVDLDRVIFDSENGVSKKGGVGTHGCPVGDHFEMKGQRSPRPIRRVLA